MLKIIGIIFGIILTIGLIRAVIIKKSDNVVDFIVDILFLDLILDFIANLFD